MIYMIQMRSVENALKPQFSKKKMDFTKWKLYTYV